MGAKILAVDDEEGILRLLKRALERDGAEVDTVSDPMRIMTGEVNPDRYDLILLDVMMPGIDGFTFLNGMRDRIDCPVLFLTAKTSEEDLMRGFGLGADDYIRKPFGIGETARQGPGTYPQRKAGEKACGYSWKSQVLSEGETDRVRRTGDFADTRGV